MRIRVRTVLLSLVVVLIVLVSAAITSVGWEVVLGPKSRPVTDRKFDVTDARLARGKYLVEGPASCFHCHSDHDLSTPTYPVVEAKKGAGWPDADPRAQQHRGAQHHARPGDGPRARGPTTRSHGRSAKA